MYIEKMDQGFYHVKLEGKPVGTFRIIEKSEGVGQIKQLEVTNTVSPGDILHIFELIQVSASEEDLNELHVESHSASLDHILDHQQFELVDVEKRLWIYKVNHR